MPGLIEKQLGFHIGFWMQLQYVVLVEVPAENPASHK